MWQKLADLAEIPIDNDFDFILKKVITLTPANDNLKKKASGIYFELLTDSRKRMGFA